MRAIALMFLVAGVAMPGVGFGAPVVNGPTTLSTGWVMQDAGRVAEASEVVSTAGYRPVGWYRATVPGTVLTTLVANEIYPEPLYGETMRTIPESLNKTQWWFRTTFPVRAAGRGRHTWLHFGGVNYESEVWVNGHLAGARKGGFVRGDYDVTQFLRPGARAVVAVLVKPQPHPGIPHEHTQANGVGKNGGETALDGATFLSTIGWDWLVAIRDRDTGIWLPVTVGSTGPVVVKNPFVTAKLAAPFQQADLTLAVTLVNLTDRDVKTTLRGQITGATGPMALQYVTTLKPGETTVLLDTSTVAALHMDKPELWWPNGYGPQNLYHLSLAVDAGGGVSDGAELNFGVRRIDYQVADSENLTISVNGVKVMVRGGNWGLDEGMKRVPLKRLDAQFHMHALANMNMIRNWVGQSTSPDFYAMADKYGMLLWDEFFQPNPSDGPDPADVPAYLANVQDKILQYRNHPSIAVWCARNEGYPPKALDDMLKVMMASLDPSRLYQSNSADGRGVSSHGPYYWREPRLFYKLTESFKTETGSMSVPTIESIQGMMPEKDWETINDDWAQHDMAKGAQHGDSYPQELAKRFGPIRNLADFVRKAQLANYEAYRAMYEGRNAQMFTATTGVLTWMSHPAQPSFVWQLYHYDLDPNASLYGVRKASETQHVQLNQENQGIEIVNNSPQALISANVAVTVYKLDGSVAALPKDEAKLAVITVPGSTTVKAGVFSGSGLEGPHFIKLDLTDNGGKLLSTNLYWQNSGASIVDHQDDFTELAGLATATLDVSAAEAVAGPDTVLTVTLKNPAAVVALLTHLQLHKKDGTRVLPAFYSDNYVSLAPGESRTMTITAATTDIVGGPVLLVDGFNVGVRETATRVPVRLNENAQPMHWPTSGLVPPVAAAASKQ